jgi:acetylornithine/succinyldiaminopimelate/putrescine aminotransferase
VDREGLLRTLSGLHAGYECLAMCGTFDDALALARNVGAGFAADTKTVHLAATEDDALKGKAGVVVVIETESLGRHGAWFASVSWRVRPSLIVAGDALAAGRDFGAVFIDRNLASQVTPAATAGFTPPPDETVALVQGVVDAVEAQHLVAGTTALASYFRERMESVQSTCNDIAEMQFAGLSVRIRLAPEMPALQLKRRLCERGLLVGIDHRSGIVIRPPLAIRPAEIDVISGVLRGALLGTVTARAPVCCAACQRDDA